MWSAAPARSDRGSGVGDVPGTGRFVEWRRVCSL